MEQYVQLISTVGFPIVAYLLMVFKSDKTLEALRSAVENNTTAIQSLMKEREK